MTLPTAVIKGHATANDFLIYDDPAGVFAPTEEEIRHFCDRHRGIGADGVIRLVPTELVAGLDEGLRDELLARQADWFMDYYNADGSVAEMCGNGSRLTALVAQHMKLMGEDGDRPLRLGTRAGLKVIEPLGSDPQLGDDVFRVSMGAWRIGELGALTVAVDGTDAKAAGTYVDMGNPHVVSVLEDATGTVDGRFVGSRAGMPAVEELDLSEAPVVSPALDHGQNVEFVRLEQVTDGRGTAFMRVHERGCGETMSCGTGICATAITLRALTGVDEWTIRVRGGLLRVAVSDDAVTLTGPATIIARCRISNEPIDDAHEDEGLF